MKVDTGSEELSRQQHVTSLLEAFWANRNLEPLSQHYAAVGFHLQSVMHWLQVVKHVLLLSYGQMQNAKEWLN